MSSDFLSMRPATLADVAILRHWDEQPHVIACDPNDDWQWESSLAEDTPYTERWIAQWQHRPIGYLEILTPHEDPEQYWGHAPADVRALDIWIGEANDLNQGYGTAMMQWALNRCFAEKKASQVWIDPLADNHDALRFYRRFGFEFLEMRTFGKDLCAVHTLSRANYQRRQG